MKKYLLLSLLFFIVISVYAQADFEKFKKEQIAQEQQYKEEQAKAFANYYSMQDSLFIKYKDKIEKLWNNYLESTPTTWVSYNSDFTGRSQVDFKKNKIKVESVTQISPKEGDEKIKEKKAKEALKKQIVAILKEKDNVTNEPILKGQVYSPDNKVIKQNEIEKVAANLVKKSKKIVFKNKKGKEMVKYQINLNLIPNNIKIRVERYKPIIERYCRKYKMDKSLVLAIIHTESFFNPRAYNRHGNAYGMMQIVPQYAGLTMNNYIFKRNRKPSPRQLFNPRINLEMGIGYLRWLADNKWAKVTNRANQNYCIVCSYNGGPGTIYKAMTGKMRKIGQRRWDKMIYDLNTMNNEKLYRKLIRDVPFEETRNYLKLVRERMNKYYNKF